MKKQTAFVCLIVAVFMCCSLSFAKAQNGYHPLIEKKKWSLGWSCLAKWMLFSDLSFQKSPNNYWKITDVLLHKGISVHDLDSFEANFNFGLTWGNSIYALYAKRDFDGLYGSEIPNKFMLPSGSTRAIGFSPFAFRFKEAAETVYDETLEIRPLLEISRETVVLTIYEKVHNGTLDDLLKTVQPQYKELQIEGSEINTKIGFRAIASIPDIFQMTLSIKYLLDRDCVSFGLSDLPSLNQPRWNFSFGFSFGLNAVNTIKERFRND